MAPKLQGTMNDNRLIAVQCARMIASRVMSGSGSTCVAENLASGHGAAW